MSVIKNLEESLLIAEQKIISEIPDNLIKEDARDLKDFDKAYDNFEEVAEEQVINISMRIDDGESGLEKHRKDLEKAYDMIEKGVKMFRSATKRIPTED